MNEIEALRAGGFTPDEINEYQTLSSGGFSPAEIQKHFELKRATVTPNAARGVPAYPLDVEGQWGTEAPAPKPQPRISNDPEDYIKQLSTGQPDTFAKPVPAALERPGEHTLTPLEQLMYSQNPAGREDLIAHAMVGGMQPDTVAGIVSGATRPIKAVARLGKGAAERQASRLMNVSPNAPEVNTLMEQGFNPTTGNLQEQVVGAQKELWPQIESMVQSAGPIKTHDALQALADLEGNLRRLGPAAAGQADQAASYLEMLKGYPHSIPAPLAQDIKQFLNQAITTFDKSLVKTEAMSGLAGGQRAFQTGLKTAIEKASADPEKLAAMNREYGNLSDLFSPSAAVRGKPTMPAEMADVNIAKMSPVGLPSWVPGASRSNVLIEKGAWPINKMLSKAGAWGETPTGLEGMLGLREPVITPSSGPMQGPPNMPKGLPAPAIPLGHEVPENVPPANIMPLQEQLPAPTPESLTRGKLTGTRTGAMLTPEDINAVQDIAAKDPGGFRDLMNMMRMKELTPEAAVGGKIPSRLSFGERPTPTALENFMNEGAKGGEFRDINTIAKEGGIPNLGVSTEIKDPSIMLKDSGMKVNGVTPETKLPVSERGKGGLYWFTDPKTGSTHAMYARELTPESLQAKLDASRAAFGKR